MKPRHQVSRAAIELIQRFEGYRRRSAQLADGRWTIGYGHTLTARQGAEVSESDAEALLIYDLINVAHVVNEHSYAPLTQNQFDALCCFAFNIGVENFRRSAVLRRINEGQLLQAACAMELWRKADFEGERIVIDALVRRRSAEKTLFLTPEGGWLPAPSPVLPPKIDVDSLGIVPATAPTVLTTALTGDHAVARRETPAPAQPVPQTTASEIAVVSVAAQLSQLLAEPDVAPEAVAAEPAPSETPEIEPVAEVAPEPVPEPAPEPQPEAPPPPVSEPTLDLPPIPAPDQDAVEPPPAPVAEPGPAPEREIPAPLPTYAVAGERDFTLTAPTDAEVPVESEDDRFAFSAPEAAAEPEPELFDPAREQPRDPFAATGADLVRVEPVRTLAEANPAPRLMIDDTVFDPVNTFDATFADAAKPFSLRTVAPLLLLALLGLAFFAGGIFWGFAAGDGRRGLSDPMTLLGWGLGIVGIACFSGAIYLLLRRLVGEDSDET